MIWVLFRLHVLDSWSNHEVNVIYASNCRPLRFKVLPCFSRPLGHNKKLCMSHNVVSR